MPDQTPYEPFGARLRVAMDSAGPLCAGIDPHPGLLDAWGLPDSPAGLESFAQRCVEAFAGVVACVKPQSAFFERHGAAGLAVLERTLTALRAADTLSILDVKRGDIGSTMDAYAHAYLADGAPLAADAITVSPYLGYGSLRPALDLALRTGRGVFVLALTSNPEGATVQHATVPGGAGSVAASIVAGVTSDNAQAAAQGRLGSVGMVVGATVGDAVAQLGLDLAAANAPLLAPGVGAQGATGADVVAVFGEARRDVLAASSRELLSTGPQVDALRAAAQRTATQFADMWGAP
ncbi:MAG: orotidine-5'-phosphate decarboxylase [Dermatophilaceae bacterium]